MAVKDMVFWPVTQNNHRSLYGAIGGLPRLCTASPNPSPHRAPSPASPTQPGLHSCKSRRRCTGTSSAGAVTEDASRQLALTGRKAREHAAAAAPPGTRDLECSCVYGCNSEITHEKIRNLKTVRQSSPNSQGSRCQADSK